MPLDGTTSPGQDVIARVAAAFGIPAEQIIAQRRDKVSVRARWAAYVVLRDRMQWRLKDIGALFSGQDHSTVCHGITQAACLMDRDEQFRDKVVALTTGAKPSPKITKPENPTAELDYIVVDRLAAQARMRLMSILRASPDTFRAKYAKTYKRVREAVQ